MTAAVPPTGYLLAGLGVMFLVTVALRAAPFVALTRLRDTTSGCIGCGCLSTTSCPIANADDALGAEGSGARRWPALLREERADEPR